MMKNYIKAFADRLAQVERFTSIEQKLDRLVPIERFNSLEQKLDQLAQVERFNSLEQKLDRILESIEKEDQNGLFPAGHFYSPIPNLDEIRKNEASIWGTPPKEIRGIDLNEQEQLKMLNTLRDFYDELPFPETKTEGLRYYFENPAYSYSDAIFLHCMIRFAKPQRIIEVGSGHSSSVILDTNELFFHGAIETTFIEPYPELFFSLLKRSDREKVKVIPIRLQDVDPAEFDSLERNDILFIDSTHVSKVNSDVNRIFFNILPRLKSGVFIHFHDIFYPFEYPQAWIYEGRAWNEIYLLRAFLENNSAFKIVVFNTYLEAFHEEFFKLHMPLCLKNKGGSIWLQKL
jgi:hypothetical protein